jgi:hypothetical protein
VIEFSEVQGDAHQTRAGMRVFRSRAPALQVLVTEEPYGYHFSVSGRMRKATDRECIEAQAWLLEHDVLPSGIEWAEGFPKRRANPYVRHFARQGVEL